MPVPGVELKLVPAGNKLEVRVRGPTVTPVAALTSAAPRAILLAAQLTILLAVLLATPGRRRCRPLPAWPTWTG